MTLLKTDIYVTYSFHSCIFYHHRSIYKPMNKHLTFSYLRNIWHMLPVLNNFLIYIHDYYVNFIYRCIRFHQENARSLGERLRVSESASLD